VHCFFEPCKNGKKELTHLSYLLVRHPEVLRKLRTEIMETLSGKETLNRNDLRQVKYLTDVLKESKAMILFGATFS
jgi:cytochrome P450